MIGAGARQATIALSLLVVSWSAPAVAYRPFDGTDATVAAPGEFEVELGPVGYLREGSDRSIVAPALVLNYGFAERWEAVLQSRAQHGLSGDNRQSTVNDDGAFLKGVVREGSLQGHSGPSVATEFGVLLPGVNDEHGVGGSVAAIVSQQFSWLTVHLNGQAAVTRADHADLFIGAIIEGPRDWTVRPVAEVFYDREFDATRTVSGLIGAIWQALDNLALDVALREARANDRSDTEIRAGLTFSFPVR